MPYEPLVYVDEGGEVFPQPNPVYRRGARRRFVRSESAKGLRVQVALIREPGFSLVKAPLVTASQSAYRVIKDALVDDPQESFGVLLLTARNKVTGIFTAHRGTMTGVSVHPADVFRPALVAGVPAVILFHNHPSGDAEPSADDRELTERAVAAGKLLGVAVLDHLIIGEAGYVSFADRGLLER